MNKKLILFLLCLSVFVLLFIPYVGEFLRTFNTLIHESGHAIMALVTGGDVVKIELYSNTEGVTQNLISGNLSAILVSLSGYLSTTLGVIIMFYLIKKESYRILFYSITLLSIVNLIFWIRNVYGFLWILSFIILLGLIIFKNRDLIKNTVYCLFIILLVDSTRSVIDIFYLSYKTPGDAGDTSVLSNATLIPDLVWGILFLLQHLIGLFIVFKINSIINYKYKNNK